MVAVIEITDEMMKAALTAYDGECSGYPSDADSMRAAIAAVAPLLAANVQKHLQPEWCPFDREDCDIDPETPCPVCGDLGTFDDDTPSKCISRSAAIRGTP